MAKDERKLIPADEWVSKFSSHLVDQVFTQFSLHKENGAELLGDVAVSFLARYVGVLVYQTLSKLPAGNKSKLSKEELYKFTMNNYGELKMRVQDAVAAGFQGAMSQYSGKDIEYYCQVKPVPQPVSKILC